MRDSWDWLMSGYELFGNFPIVSFFGHSLRDKGLEHTVYCSDSNGNAN